MNEQTLRQWDMGNGEGRPGMTDWEVLADADAEYAAWLDEHHALALAAIDRDAPYANDVALTAA